MLSYVDFVNKSDKVIELVKEMIKPIQSESQSISKMGNQIYQLQFVVQGKSGKRVDIEIERSKMGLDYEINSDEDIKKDVEDVIKSVFKDEVKISERIRGHYRFSDLIELISNDQRNVKELIDDITKTLNKHGIEVSSAYAADCSNHELLKLQFLLNGNVDQQSSDLDIIFTNSNSDKGNKISSLTKNYNAKLLGSDVIKDIDDTIDTFLTDEEETEDGEQAVDVVKKIGKESQEKIKEIANSEQAKEIKEKIGEGIDQLKSNDTVKKVKEKMDDVFSKENIDNTKEKVHDFISDFFSTVGDMIDNYKNDHSDEIMKVTLSDDKEQAKVKFSLKDDSDVNIVALPNNLFIVHVEDDALYILVRNNKLYILKDDDEIHLVSITFVKSDGSEETFTEKEFLEDLNGMKQNK